MRGAAKRRTASVLAAILLLALASRAAAHEGPPFPLIVDRVIGAWKVSVWADPDIGTGTFIVVLEPRGARPVETGTRVRVGVRPVSGRLPESFHDAVPDEVRYGERHVAEVPFDRGEMWLVRFLIDGPGGAGEMDATVEATPDGSIGPIGMVVYLLPFLAVGWLWLKVALRKRAIAREEAGPSTEPGGEERIDTLLQ